MAKDKYPIYLDTTYSSDGLTKKELQAVRKHDLKMRAWMRAADTVRAIDRGVAVIGIPATAAVTGILTGGFTATEGGAIAAFAWAGGKWLETKFNQHAYDNLVARNTIANTDIAKLAAVEATAKSRKKGALIRGGLALGGAAATCAAGVAVPVGTLVYGITHNAIEVAELGMEASGLIAVGGALAIAAPIIWGRRQAIAGDVYREALHNERKQMYSNARRWQPTKSVDTFLASHMVQDNAWIPGVASTLFGTSRRPTPTIP